MSVICRRMYYIETLLSNRARLSWESLSNRHRRHGKGSNGHLPELPKTLWGILIQPKNSCWEVAVLPMNSGFLLVEEETVWHAIDHWRERSIAHIHLPSKKSWNYFGKRCCILCSPLISKALEVDVQLSGLYGNITSLLPAYTQGWDSCVLSHVQALQHLLEPTVRNIKQGSAHWELMREELSIQDKMPNSTREEMSGEDACATGAETQARSALVLRGCLAHSCGSWGNSMWEPLI